MLRQLTKTFRPTAHRAGFLGIFYVLLILVLLKYLAFYVPSPLDAAILIGKTLLASALVGASVFGFATLLNHLRGDREKGYAVYLAELSAISLLVTAERALLAFSNFPSAHLVELSQPYWQTFVLNVAMLLVINAALNASQRSITEKLSVAELLAASLRARQQALVFSDEDIREQVAQFLHNRIQSDLMVSSLQLKAIAAESDFAQGSKLMDIVAKLEKVRSMDIRGLSQSLGPSLGSQDLGASLQALASQYRGQMNVRIVAPQGLFTDDLVTREQHQLGLYRIAEQAVLNALVHGPAKNVEIEFVINANGSLTMTVQDDGPGAVKISKPGLGASIMDAWVDILGGSMEAGNNPRGGYLLRVEFPL